VIHVTVRLHGALRQYRPADAPGAPHHPFTLTVDAPLSVEAIAQRLAIPDGLLAGAAVNGETAELTAPVGDGDMVAFFPPSAGG
jgi:hypothetical protein